MTENKLNSMSDETITKQLYSLYHDGIVNPYAADQIKILLAEKSSRELKHQSEVNSKISIRSQRIALIALLISIISSLLFMYFTWNDSKLDKKRFDVLKEIRNNTHEMISDK